MKLHKALKVKNRLAGEVGRLQELFRRENSRRNDNPSTVDRTKVLAELDKKSQSLIAIKTAIAKANVNIYAVLEEMAELKAKICWLQSLSTRRGEEIVFVGRDQEKLVYTWDACFTREEIDDKVEFLQKTINDLQDQADAYNAVTEINFEE